MIFFRKNNCGKYAIGVTGLLYLLQLTLLPIGHAILHLEDSNQHHENCDLDRAYAPHFTSDCQGPCENPDHEHEQHTDSSHSSENCSVCKTLVFAAVNDFHRYAEVSHHDANLIIDKQLLLSQNLSFYFLSRGPPISPSDPFITL